MHRDRCHLNQLFKVFKLGSLFQKVSAIKFLVLKLCFEVTPWQFLFVQEIHHKYHSTYDIISSTLNSERAAIKARKFKVALEISLLTWLYVRSIFFLEGVRLSKVNQINLTRVLYTNQNVGGLYVVVHKAQAVKCLKLLNQLEDDFVH